MCSAAAAVTQNRANDQPVDGVGAIGKFRPVNGAGIMRAVMAAIIFAALVGAGVAAPSHAAAQDRVEKRLRVAMPARQDMTPSRRRTRVRIYRADDRGVYPRYFPGSNAVRDCTATYVQEFRPSGTVITPRMSCFWRQP